MVRKVQPRRPDRQASTDKDIFREQSPYSVNDVVSFERRSWIATQDTTASQDPNFPGYWQLLAGMGYIGQQGPQGEAALAGQQELRELMDLRGLKARGVTMAFPAVMERRDGEVEPSGPVGPKGLVGPAGTIGARGVVGATGMAGSQGVMEIVGTAGPKGDSAYWALVAQRGQSGNVHRVAGLSSTLVAGNSGVSGLSLGCQSDYGPGARVATSEELFLTPQVSVQPGLAWVQATLVGEGFTDMISGHLQRALSQTCGDWSNGAGIGLVVDGSTLSFATSTCSLSQYVACAVESSTPEDYLSAGLTTASVTGDSGLQGLHGACHADYGANARMATTEEVFQTPGSTAQSGPGWVQAVLVGNGLVEKTTGLSDALSGHTCAGWANTLLTTGLVVNGSDMMTALSPGGLMKLDVES